MQTARQTGDICRIKRIAIIGKKPRLARCKAGIGTLKRLDQPPRVFVQLLTKLRNSLSLQLGKPSKTAVLNTTHTVFERGDVLITRHQCAVTGVKGDILHDAPLQQGGPADRIKADRPVRRPMYPRVNDPGNLIKDRVDLFIKLRGLQRTGGKAAARGIQIAQLV